MEHCYILRYGEIALRGQNRRMYEDFLEANTKRMIHEHNANAKIKRYRGRMIVISENKLPFLNKIFGVISVSESYRVKRDADEINLALKIFDNPRIKIKFADKGKEDLDLTKRIHNGENGIAYVEIYPENAFVYSKKEKAAGGLPVGCEGKVIVEIKDDKGLLAALLMMKRGCDVIPITNKNIQILRDYGCYNEPAKDISSTPKDAIATVLTEKNSLPKLNPLAGMNENDIKKSLEKFSDVKLQSLGRTEE